MAASKTYRYVDDHASEIPKGDTRIPVGMGDFVELSAEEVKNERVQMLIDDGRLIDVASLPADEVAKPTATTEEVKK